MGDATCTLDTEAGCDDAGGTYQGDGSVCADVTCPLLTGACLFFESEGGSGNCIETTEADCESQGGYYQGDGTTCPPEGACCISGNCFETTPANCSKAGGTYQGDDVACEDVTCPQPSNDLCDDAFELFLGDTPFDTTQALTDGANPVCVNVDNDIWYDFEPAIDGLLTVSTCNNADFDTAIAIYDGCFCPADNENVIGCNDDATGCAGNTSVATAIVFSDNCYKVRLGAWGGGGGADPFGSGGDSGTGILSVSLEGLGACCLYKSPCEITTEAECEEMYGGYQGDGSTCSDCDLALGVGGGAPVTPSTPGPGSPVNDPLTFNPDRIVIEASGTVSGDGASAAGGGTPEPDGEYTIMLEGVCFANEVPTGACIFPDGSCDITTEFECVRNSGGNWLGEDVPVPRRDPADGDLLGHPGADRRER